MRLLFFVAFSVSAGVAVSSNLSLLPLADSPELLDHLPRAGGSQRGRSRARRRCVRAGGAGGAQVLNRDWLVAVWAAASGAESAAGSVAVEAPLLAEVSCSHFWQM